MTAKIKPVILRNMSSEESDYDFMKFFTFSKLGQLFFLQNHKKYFQEYIQRNGSANITYEVTGFEGPPHRRKFFVELYLNGELVGKGSGFSKKEAEQNAAKQALVNAGEYNE